MQNSHYALATCSRGTMALTLSQMFMGALTIGIAVGRGTESYESFYVETQLGHSNYAASKLSADHARSANVNATNNVISAAILGPRFAVEADNITMIANAIIACPQWKNPQMVRICQEFKQNYPRMLRKLAWVRVKQKAVWSSLGNLSAAIDKVASIRATEQIQSFTRGLDGAVAIRVEDPAMTMNLWSTDITATACQNAVKDALPSPMPGAAFPVLIHVNLLQGLPKALVQIMPRLLCGGASAALSEVAGAGGGGSGEKKEETEKLSMVPNVAKTATEDCTALETEMHGAVAQGAPFSTDVSKYAVCGSTSSHVGDGAADAAGAAAAPCTFDRKRCEDDMLEKASADFLESVGMPKISSTSAMSLGGGTFAPTDADWNHSDTMRACAFATKPIDATVIRINDAARTIMSFGTASPSTTLRQRREYKTCGRWYFPDGDGSLYAIVPHDQQPFVAAWKYALVGAR